MFLLNARLSNRSFRRWRLAGELFGAVTSNLQGVHSRSFLDCARFQLLGHLKTVAAIGDLKFIAESLPYNPIDICELAPFFLCRPSWLAASTHPGEEEIISRVHNELRRNYPSLLTIIVPRHPERGAVLAQQLGARQRSDGKTPPRMGLWIADTYGELGLWFRLISIVFVGRSLVPKGGGQNIMEPARLGCSVAIGPLASNFTDHLKLLRVAGAIQEVSDSVQLGKFVHLMLSEPYIRRQRGLQASQVTLRLASHPQNFLPSLNNSLEIS